MALDFPESPTVGDVYSSWTWDGEAWVLTPDTSVSDLAARVLALEEADTFIAE